MRFLDLLFPLRADERIVREITEDIFMSLAEPRLVPETRPSTIALLPFCNNVVRAAIHEAKYHGSIRAFSLLGQTLAEYLTDTDALELKNSCLVPLPLGKKRRQERGFNQAEEITYNALRNLANKELFVLDCALLKRIKETETQVSLERSKRELNMHGAFITTRKANSQCVYYLIDDVITTGATMQAAIDALHIAGAEHIIPLAIAH